MTQVTISLNGAHNVNIHQWVNLTYQKEAEELKELYEALSLLRSKKVLEGFRIEVVE